MGSSGARAGGTGVKVRSACWLRRPGGPDVVDYEGPSRSLACDSGLRGGLPEMPRAKRVLIERWFRGGSVGSRRVSWPSVWPTARLSRSEAGKAAATPTISHRTVGRGECNRRVVLIPSGGRSRSGDFARSVKVLDRRSLPADEMFDQHAEGILRSVQTFDLRTSMSIPQHWHVLLTHGSSWELVGKSSAPYWAVGEHLCGFERTLIERVFESLVAEEYGRCIAVE